MCTLGQSSLLPLSLWLSSCLLKLSIVDQVGKVHFKQESLAIKTFGSAKVEERMRDVVELELYSVQGRKPLRIVASVVQHISEIRHEHPEIVRHNFHHLANMWFSDVSPRQESLTSCS